MFELERRLSVLPADRWRIEPYPLTGERGNTLLVLGETGVFVISATYAPGHWDDVITVNRLARKIQALLPGYPARCARRSAIRSRRCRHASGIARTSEANGSRRGWSAATRWSRG